MSNFIVIEKDSLNKVSVNAERIVLSESSIVHTKMNRDDVAEFIRDGNNLILKLTNGEVVVIENFFVVDAEGVTSDLVFEEDGCVLYWFDGLSGFKEISGLEALLPAVEGSKLVGLLPWLVGAAVVGGAAAIIDHNDDDKKKDTTAPTAPTVEINDGGDGVINPTDLVNGKVTVTVKPTEPVVEGDKITITHPDGSIEEIEVTASNKDDINNNGITVGVTPAEEGEDTVVTATVTDKAGNESPEGSDNSKVDLVVPGDVDGDGEKDPTGAPVVVIQDGGDDVINPSDVDENGKVDAIVTFPKDAGYSVGDTVVIKDQTGEVLVDRPLTAEDLENGIPVKATPADEGKDTVVTAVVTDPQGNESPEGSDNSKVDLVVPGDVDGDGEKDPTGAPVVVIQDGGDDVINPSDVDENGKVDAIVTFPKDAGYSVGDTVVIKDQTGEVLVDRPLTAEDLENGIPVKATPADEGKDTVVTAVVTDPQGNESPEGSDNSKVDLVVPGDVDGDGEKDPTGAPVVVIQDGGDDVINPSDVDENGKVDAIVTFPKDAGYSVGDTVVIKDQTGEVLVDRPLTAEDLENGIPVKATPADEGKDTVVTAVVTDPQGNESPEGSDNSKVDLVVPGDVDGDGEKDPTGAPVVVIQDGGDDVINPSDVDENGKVDAIVTFPKDAGYSVGDTVVIKDQTGEVLVDRPLTAEDLENGIPVKATPADEGKDTVVTAVVTDPQGNESPEGSDNSKVDLVVPGDVDGDGEKDPTGAPVVVIQDGGDDVINPSDVDENGKVDAIVTFPKDAGYSVGDTVVIKDQTGEVLVDRPLTAEDLENGIPVKATPADEGKDTVVTAVVTDPQGNESPEGSDNSKVDLVVPGDVDGDGEKDPIGAPVVVIQDGGDDVINPSDVDENGKVDAIVTFPKDAGYSVGDTVVIKDQTGEVLVDRPLTAEDLENGIPVKATPADEGKDTVVTAVVTDPQGNESPEGSDNSKVDLVVPGDVDGDGEKDPTGAPVVVIQDGGDDVINPSDVDENGKVDAIVTFPKDAGYSVGDTVVIKDQTGEVLVDRPLTAEDLENGIPVKATPADEGKDTVVTAVVTDPQGNESPEGSDNSKVDLVVPGDVDGDGEKDPTGAPVVVIQDGGDDVINPSDVDENGKVDAIVTFPKDAGYSVGDTVVIKDQTGEVLVDRPLTAEDLENGIPVKATPADEGKDTVVTAVVTDPQGNESPEGSDNSKVDLVVPGDVDGDGEKDPTGAPVVVIQDGGDDVINPSDVDENGKVDAIVTFPKDAGYSVGDTVVIKDQTGEVLVDRPLTAEDLENGIPVKATPADEGKDTVVTAVVTDPQGNESPEGSDNSKVDLVVPGDVDGDGEKDPIGAPVVVIQDGGDDVINPSDVDENGKVDAIVTFPKDAGYSVGDTVVIKDQTGEVLVDRPLTAEDLENGIPVKATPADEGKDTVVTAVVTDPQGNESPEGSDNSKVDLVVPGDVDGDGEKDPTGAPVVVIQDGGDDVINPSDVDENGKVDAIVTFPKDAGYSVGDTVVIKDQTGEVLVDRPLTAEDLENGIPVKATPADEGKDTVVTAVVTDPQGNESPEGSDNSKVDLVVPGDVDGDGEKDPTGAPVVVIQDGGDDVINPSDVDENGKVDAIVTFPKDAGYSVGDTVVIKDQTGEVLVDRPLTAEDLENGIPVKATPADEGKDTVVTAVVTDPQGNESPEGSDNSKVDLVVPGDVDGDGEKDPTGAPVVVIQDGGDDVINPSDVDENGKVDAIVTFPKDAGYSVGDTVVIKDQTGEVLVDRPLTAEDLENGIPVKATPADEGKDTVVTAVVTDPQGNTSPEGKDSSSVDLVVPGDVDGDGEVSEDEKLTGAPVVVIQDGDDGVIDPSDLNDDDTTVDAIVTFPEDAGYSVGDTVVIKDQDGNTLYEGELGQGDLDNGITVKVTPAEEGKDTVVTAVVTDPQGNKSPEGSDNSTVDSVDNGDNIVIGAAGNDVLAGDTGGLKTNFVAGANYNVSIVLDLSGSMYFGMDGTTPKNPTTGRDDYSPTGVLPDGMLSRLEIAKAGLKAFIAQMADHDGVINLQISTFSATGAVGNQSKWDKVFLDVTADNIDAIFEHIGSGKGGAGDGLTAGGGTYPELSFKEATDWFNSSEIKSNNYENQTYYITDGEPNTDETKLDNAFKPLAEVSKVFAVGVSSSVSNETVSRYDNTDVNGDKIADTWNGNDNHGTAQAIADADKLIAYLIGGSENFVPADVGNDVVKGGAGDDILFGDAMNTDWITGLDPLQYPKYSGYSKLIAHLKAEETGGAEPTQQEIYDFVKANYMEFVNADAADPNTKGGNDTIYGGSGNDIIIAGAGDDRIYGGSGDDIISTGRGNDTIVYDVLDAADAMGGNGTDTWIDYETNDKIEFGAEFFEGLFEDKSNISEYIKVEDVNGKAVLKVDRDGAAANGGTTHDWADLLIIEGKTASELQELINNQIIIVG